MATTPKGIYYPNDYNEIADIPEDMKKMAESIEEVFEDTDSDLSGIKEEQTTQNNRLNSLEVDNTTNKSDILTNKQEINNIKTEQTTQNNRLSNLETDNTTNKNNISANTQEINNIKQEQTEQNTNISTNATNIESLQEENENLKKIVNQLPQVEGQGTSITLEDTIEAPFTKFDVEGNSVQDGSPSPDNEVPIYSAGDNGSINEKINNKNWFNKNGNFKTYNATVTPIDTGIKVENNDGGTYRSVWCEIGKDELLGKTLTIQTSISTYNGAIPRIIVVFNNETAQYIAQIKTITDTTEGTLVNIPNSFPENADRVSLIFYCSFTSATPKGSYVEYKDLQVELGSTATPFVEHEEQDYSIFVQQPMRSIGDVRDDFVRDEQGNWFERHKIGETILDDTANITRYEQDGIYKYYFNDIAVAGKVINSFKNLCNYAYWNNYISGQWVKNGFGYHSGAKSWVLSTNVIATLEELKTALSNEPLVTNYILQDPTLLPCTEEQIQQLENLPSTYKDFTYVVSEDETEAYLEVSGIRDIDTMFDKVTNAIVSLGGNV